MGDVRKRRVLASERLLKKWQRRRDKAIRALERLEDASRGVVGPLQLDGDLMGTVRSNAAYVAKEIVKAAGAGQKWRHVCGMRLVDDRIANRWIERERAEAEEADSGGSD